MFVLLKRKHPVGGVHQIGGGIIYDISGPPAAAVVRLRIDQSSAQPDQSVNFHCQVGMGWGTNGAKQELKFRENF